jgi:hypothetical protein
MNVFQWYIGDIAMRFRRHQCIFNVFECIWAYLNVSIIYISITFTVFECIYSIFECILTPKGPMSVDGFLGSSGRLSRRQKHEWTSKILEEGRRI